MNKLDLLIEKIPSLQYNDKLIYTSLLEAVLSRKETFEKENKKNMDDKEKNMLVIAIFMSYFHYGIKENSSIIVLGLLETFIKNEIFSFNDLLEFQANYDLLKEKNFI